MQARPPVEQPYNLIRGNYLPDKLVCDCVIGTLDFDQFECFALEPGALSER